MNADAPVVYRRAVPTEKCYLAEVLLWHAFGRFPEEMRLPGMTKDWRFSEDILEDYKAPHPGGFILSPEECDYAAIVSDPVGHARAEGVEIMRPDRYPEALHSMAALKGKDSIHYRAVEYDFEISKAIHKKFEGWEQERDSYVDLFATEILLQLRKGNLKARGTKLPFSDRKSVNKYLSFKEIGLEDLNVVEIPDNLWVTKAVNWEESSLTHPKHAFIWIHLDTSEVLKLFPPKRILNGAVAGVLTGAAAITSPPIVIEANLSSKRGRPPLPWELFHVEVARLFRDDKMPSKKESAIAYFTNWFKKELGEEASRSAVGQRLKIYYDQLFKKKTENSGG